MRVGRWYAVSGVLLVVVSRVAPPIQAQDTPATTTIRPSLARQQGRWQAVKFERQGKTTEAAITASISRAVTGDHVVWERDGKSFAGSTIRLDDKAEPATIDVLADGGPSRGKAVLGIYRQEGDRLWICMADADQPRPTAFEALVDKPWNLMEFKREPEPKRTP